MLTSLDGPVTFDDVLIKPQFSTIRSRAEVNLYGHILRNDGMLIQNWLLPLMSANMDTVTGVEMTRAMTKAGATSCLHRFWSVSENVKAWEANPDAWVSIGLGEIEFTRARALHEVGARRFIIDVAHGAQAAAAEQYVLLKALKDTFVVVGNFATAESVTDFYRYMNIELKANLGIDGVKVGVGPGSACTTRLKTGIGIPQLQAILDIRNKETSNFHPYPGFIIADGGCRTPGDIAKALAAGADLVMLGGMLAGTDETPGEVLEVKQLWDFDKVVVDRSQAYKKYRGSASKESYEAQGKDQKYITTEGEAFTVPCKGPVATVLQDIEGGLRSALSYVGAKDLKEFREKAEFIRVTSNAVKESGAHGKQG